MNSSTLNDVSLCDYHVSLINTAFYVWRDHLTIPASVFLLFFPECVVNSQLPNENWLFPFVFAKKNLFFQRPRFTVSLT